MALEQELRSRVDQALREIQEIIESLSHVKHLADKQSASVEQMSSVATTLTTVGEQLKALTITVGQTGPVLQSAVDVVKSSDPSAILNRADAISQSVSALDARLGSFDARLEQAVQLGEASRATLDPIRLSVEAAPVRAEAAARAQAAALERLEQSISATVDRVHHSVEAMKKQLGTTSMAAWAAAALALVAAVVSVVGALR